MKRYLILFLTFLIACTSSQPKAASLRISFNNYPLTLDPRKTGDFTSASLICMTFEGLHRCGPEEVLMPAIAKKIDLSSDKKTYTFHLRKTFWTDGTPVSAYDFEASWKQSIDPTFPSLSSFLFFPIKNVKNYIEGKVALSEVGIYALDASTLRVELEKPTPYFPSLTACPSYFPIPSHLGLKTLEWESDADIPFVCNGPFQIQKMCPNNEILLVKNKSFWNPKQTHLDSIHISILSDETTALQMFEQDELDFVGGALSPLPPDALQNLQNQNKLQFMPMEASTFCTFNTKVFPFHNLFLRKAFSYAIDRQSIIKETSQTGQIPAASLLPPTLYTNHQVIPNKELEIDAKKARFFLRQGLRELNLPKSSLNNITLYYKQGQSHQRLAQTLQKNWKNVLGIHINIEQLDQKGHQQKLHKRDYQIAIGYWISQFHDPVSILDRFQSSQNSKNYPGWQNDTYAELLEKACLCSDLETRDLLLKEAEKLFLQEIPLTPLYHWTSPYLFHPRLKNIAVTPNGGILFEQFQMDS